MLNPPLHFGVSRLFSFFNMLHCCVNRHRWTGRYEAHLWDNSCKKEGQSRKGRQGYCFLNYSALFFIILTQLLNFAFSVFLCVSMFGTGRTNNMYSTLPVYLGKLILYMNNYSYYYSILIYILK